MPTISLPCAETRSISIAASPSAVFSFLADARNLPRWAPGFAGAVRPDGDRWVVTSGGTELAIVVRADAERGTVDLLAGPAFDRGAWSRVLPNGSGSEYVFTLFFPDGTPAEAIENQMRVVEEELQTVRSLVEVSP